MWARVRQRHASAVILARRGFSNNYGESGKTTAYIALGSNLGNRVDNLDAGLRAIRREVGQVERTSLLYETVPMYIEDQPRYLNAAVRVSTELSPQQLATALQSIETEVGRSSGQRKVRNGPRVLDLDILYFGNEIVQQSGAFGGDGSSADEMVELEVPHPRLQEREFVLRPLCDVATGNLHDPRTGQTPSEMLLDLRACSSGSLPSSSRASDAEDLCAAVMPLAGHDGEPRHDTTSREAALWRIPDLARCLTNTLVMGIVNCTPDSFSDGGRHLAAADAAAAAVNYASSRSASGGGAAIIDVGGESTRPGADPVDAEEEARRVVPAIRAIRKALAEAGAGAAISVDTYKPEVAEAAIAAGADMINDVSSGTLAPCGDKDAMFRLAADPERCPPHVALCLMHMRGDPTSMQSEENLRYAEGGGSQEDAMVREVRKFLADRVRAAERCGVARWRIAVDPGIGFAKSHEQNLVLLRRLAEITNGSHDHQGEDGDGDGDSDSDDDIRVLRGLPILVGASRKGFIGKLLEDDEGTPRAMEGRAFGTAATCVAAIVGGAGIVRVHDVRDMKDVCIVYDRILSSTA